MWDDSKILLPHEFNIWAKSLSYALSFDFESNTLFILLKILQWLGPIFPHPSKSSLLLQSKKRNNL